jgi:hypothetical protein
MPPDFILLGPLLNGLIGEHLRAVRDADTRARVFIDHGYKYADHERR